MSKGNKPSTVTLPADTVKKLRAISEKRKLDKNLAWSQVNIVIEQVDNLYKKEFKWWNYQTIKKC